MIVNLYIHAQPPHREDKRNFSELAKFPANFLQVEIHMKVVPVVTRNKHYSETFRLSLQSFSCYKPPGENNGLSGQSLDSWLLIIFYFVRGREIPMRPRNWKLSSHTSRPRKRISETAPQILDRFSLEISYLQIWIWNRLLKKIIELQRWIAPPTF